MPVRELRLLALTGATIGVVAIGMIAERRSLNTSPNLIKIGLVAPFSGRYREIGDDVIAATRVALNQYLNSRNNSDPVVELVAYDDGGNIDQAILQAQRLTADPSVSIVIGHWRDDTTAAAASIYDQRRVPLITSSSADLSTPGTVYYVSPSKMELNSLVSKWTEERPFSNLFVQDPNQDVVTVTNEARNLSLSGSPRITIGRDTLGLTQTYALTNANTSNLYFATDKPRAGDSIERVWTSGETADFVRQFGVESFGATPGQYAVKAYEAALLAINLVTRTTPKTLYPLSTRQFDSQGHVSGTPVYIYRWVGKAVLLQDVIHP